MSKTIIKNQKLLIHHVVTTIPLEMVKVENVRKELDSRLRSLLATLDRHTNSMDTVSPAVSCALAYSAMSQICLAIEKLNVLSSVSKCVKECITPEKLGFKVIEE